MIFQIEYLFRMMASNIPTELVCPICQRLIESAVMLPCCATEMCYNCAIDRLSVRMEEIWINDRVNVTTVLFTDLQQLLGGQFPRLCLSIVSRLAGSLQTEKRKGGTV